MNETELCGYREIQKPPARYAVIDQAALLELFGFRNLEQLQQACREWIDKELRAGQPIRDSAWSESLAVGHPEFIEAFKTGLGVRGIHRTLVEAESGHVLREPAVTYLPHFTGQIASLKGNNTIFVM